MSDLRVTNPETTMAYVATLAGLSVKLPLAPCNHEPGVVVDADDQPIFVIDVNNERPDAEVDQIARWIVHAVNTCGGFK